MKLIILAVTALLVKSRAGMAQIGETLTQCEAKLAPVLEKDAQGWHTLKKEPYYVLVHFYKGKADAVQYLNWIERPKALTKDEIDTLLKRTSAGRWDVVDDGAESAMYVVKGFTAIHMKLDHMLIVATDGYLERGITAQAEAEAAKVKSL
jgi:hypothetical protein